MSRKALFMLGVLFAGIAVACWVTFVLLDLNPAYQDTLATLAMLAVMLGGFPALLAALRPRVALPILIGVVVLIGIWGARLISMSGEDAVYGLFVLLIDAVLVTYGLAAIGLRKLIIKSPAA